MTMKQKDFHNLNLLMPKMKIFKNQRYHKILQIMIILSFVKIF